MKSIHRMRDPSLMLQVNPLHIENAELWIILHPEPMLRLPVNFKHPKNEHKPILLDFQSPLANWRVITHQIMPCTKKKKKKKKKTIHFLLNPSFQKKKVVLIESAFLCLCYTLMSVELFERWAKWKCTNFDIEWLFMFWINYKCFKWIAPSKCILWSIDIRHFKRFQLQASSICIRFNQTSIHGNIAL